MLVNTDMTIFNKYIENHETKYKKSYIEKVHWEDRKGANIISSGLEGVDQTTVYIPYSSCKDYISPKIFKINKTGFTLQPEDIIVKGKILDNFTTIKDLEKKYDYVRVITTVDNYDFGNLKHFEVGAK